MKPYLDTEDSFYSIKHESKTKKKDNDRTIGKVIFTVTVLSIVIALTIYTAWQITYGYEDGQPTLKGDTFNIEKSLMIWQILNT